MLMDYLRAALAATIASFFVSVGAQEFDLVSFNCLIGYENDDHPEICAEVRPDLKEQVAEANRIWRARNAKELTELRAACEARLMRAYGGDQAKILEAKREARRRRADFRSQLLAAPNRDNLVDCPAYARDFAAGGERIDIQRPLIDATRDSPARPIKWPNP